LLGFYSITKWNLYANPATFPSGIKSLADYAHSRGLLFGLYADSGLYTCQGAPGSSGFESQDAITFASWGVDYLKYDNCFSDQRSPEVRFSIMRDALSVTRRPIYYSISEWGIDLPSTWAPVVANSWRTTTDIDPSWATILNIVDQNEPSWSFGGPGGWNDPDVMEIGNGLSYTESKSHFSLWAIMKAPLLIGANIMTLDSMSLSVLTAVEVIAVNQDPLGIQGRRISQAQNLEVWGCPLQNSIAILLFNRGESEAIISFNWRDIGINPNATASIRDLWERKDLGIFANSFSSQVDPQGVVMITVTPK